MKGEQSKHVLLLLAAGVDPATGKYLPEDSVVKYPEVVQALREGVEALRRTQQQLENRPEKPAEKERRERIVPPEAEAWTEAELRQLEQWYLDGASLKKMQRTLHRSVEELEKRLFALAKLEREREPETQWSEAELQRLRKMYDEGASLDGMCTRLQRSLREVLKQVDKIEAAPQPGNRIGKPWPAWEDNLLKKHYDKGTSLESIAKILCRTEYGVQCRLESLGLRPGSGCRTAYMGLGGRSLPLLEKSEKE